ncbi:MAG: archease [Desulfobacterales bacterium]|nr:archease [Desulfobacterales bacterium]
MNSSKSDFTFLDHTADLGIKVRGSDLIGLFENAADSMMHIMVKDVHAEKCDAIRLSVDGQDLADLMVRWLGEILYLFSGEKKLVTNVKIDSISASHVDSTLEIVHFDPNIHEILCEIKAVTYHQIEVTETDDHCWEARIIFDL